MTALKSVRVGGLVVYSTCSLSPVENDSVVRKARKKMKKRMIIDVLRREFAIGEATELGWIVLPDSKGSWGPLYFSILQKSSENDDEDEEEDEDNDER
jgi:16S rRNA C967 or C1407 C5-methylase (RsmB/RsmF family)